MLLMPRGDWHWKFNHEHEVLGIHLGEELEFLTPYGERLLIPDAMYDTIFRVDHAAFYTQIIGLLKKQFDLPDPLFVQTALNATALHFKLNPQMPKSWFFKISDVCVLSDVGRVYELHTAEDKVCGLVVDQSDQAAQVMLLSEACRLHNGKTIRRFDTIKVMLDRLHPLKSEISNIFVA